uniref:Uncharacterized protein n=1 Tax=Anguilla anguilla TaxID=7936 RepID=A0A0E9XIP0_ANGAN
MNWPTSHFHLITSMIHSIKKHQRLSKQTKSSTLQLNFPVAVYCPGADRLLFINCFFTKQIHHLLGLSVWGSKTRSHSLRPVSCRICCR